MITLLLLQPMVGSFAEARRKTPMRAYSFIAEGGKASQGECDGEKKIPRKLNRLADYKKSGSYIGSEIQDPEINPKPGQQMWKHIFRDKGTCNSILAKTPSAIQDSLINAKTDLPPEDADEPEDADSKEDKDAEKEEAPKPVLPGSPEDKPEPEAD